MRLSSATVLSSTKLLPVAGDATLCRVAHPLSGDATHPERVRRVARGFLLALDPGASCGLALLQNGELRRALALRSEVIAGPCPACPLCRPGLPCDHIASGNASLVAQLRAELPELRQVDRVIIETPGFWSSCPNNAAVLTLARTAGALIGATLAAGVPLVIAIKPAEWKGTADKATFQRGILASLTAAERALLPRRPECQRYQGDALDAAGLALWAVGRLGRWCSDPADFAADVDPAPVRGKRRKPAKQVQGGLAFDFDSALLATAQGGADAR